MTLAICGRMGVSAALALACSPAAPVEPLPSSLELCWAKGPAVHDPEAVVSLSIGPFRVDSPSGPVLANRWCSGVVVAPNLVLTAMHCVTEHSAEPACRQDGSSVLEPDDALARHGAPLAPELVRASLGEPRGRVTVARASRVLTTGSPTRCQDDLAALVFDCELPVTPVPLRVEPLTRRGEALERVGYGAPLRQARDVEVVAVTQDVAGSALPMRALRTTGSACDGDSGGGLFSTETGALVGLVSHRTLPDCADPLSETIGTHLPSYVGFLERAARAAGVRLVVESRPWSEDHYSSCDSPAAPSSSIGETLVCDPARP